MNTDDFDAVQQCLTGNSQAFQSLVERYQRLVYDTVVRMVYDPETARDLTQEVFVNAYVKLHTFDARYPFRIWIHRIAVNRTIDFLRRKKPEYLLVDQHSDPDSRSLPMQIADSRPNPEANLESSETAERIKRAVYMLEPNLKAIIILRHFREMNYDQIAETLGIPIGTVKNRLFRAREKLQAVLVKDEWLEGAF
ncbi:sigma-70 family RNA polymerase sigma factor [bacterium]|nr:sigma-70 family RNA polymerase sigma factor [candidate division CSSED10-310 bacterium]